MTVSCRDCDAIPKVDRAGEVFEYRGETVQLMHNGVKVVAGGYHGDWMSQIINRLRGHHEPQEELIFHEIMKYIPASATMIELGGFWSYYSLWFLANNAKRRSAQENQVLYLLDSFALHLGRSTDPPALSANVAGFLAEISWPSMMFMKVSAVTA